MSQSVEISGTSKTLLNDMVRHLCKIAGKSDTAAASTDFTPVVNKLQEILVEAQKTKDYESVYAEDSTGAIFLEIRKWDQELEVFSAPEYYLPNSNILATPVAPVTYLDYSTLIANVQATLAQIRDEFFFTDVIDVNNGTINYYTRQRVKWDNLTSTLAIFNEYSLNGSTWSTTPPSGTQAAGWIVTNKGLSFELQEYIQLPTGVSFTKRVNTLILGNGSQTDTEQWFDNSNTLVSTPTNVYLASTVSAIRTRYADYSDRLQDPTYYTKVDYYSQGELKQTVWTDITETIIPPPVLAEVFLAEQILKNIDVNTTWVETSYIAYDGNGQEIIAKHRASRGQDGVTNLSYYTLAGVQIVAPITPVTYTDPVLLAISNKLTDVFNTSQNIETELGNSNTFLDNIDQKVVPTTDGIKVKSVISDGINNADVFDYPNANPLATQLVDTNGDPITSFATPFEADVFNTNTVTSATTILSLSVAGKSSAAFQISGAWVGINLIEVSNDGVTYYPVGDVQDIVNKKTVTSIISNGLYLVNCYGAILIRLRCNTWVSGTIIATGRVSKSVNTSFPNRALNVGSGSENIYTDFRTTALTNVIQTVKATVGNIYGIYCINSHPTQNVYLKFFDTAAPFLGIAIPKYVIAVRANSVFEMQPNNSVMRYFQSNSIKVVATRNLVDTDTVAPTTPLYLEIQYI